MEPVRVDRFAGINNRQPIDRLRLRDDEAWPVRDAVNVDLSASSTFQTRAGCVQVVDSSGCRSLFSVDGGGSLAAVGSKLMRFDGDTLSEVADLASPHANVGYASTPFGVVWSDGFRMGLVRNWVNSSLLPAAPNPIPSVTVGTGGALAAGTYGVAFAAVMPDGRRSELTVPEYVEVGQNGRIEIAAGILPLPADIFITAPDGDVFYRAGRVQVGAASIGVINPDGESVAYEVLQPLPPSRILGFHAGRLLSAVGSVLLFSRPYSLGLHRPETDFIQFPDDIRLIASLSTGVLIVATESKHWLIAGDMESPTMSSIAPYGAVAGTAVDIPNSEGLMWFTPRGQVLAGEDGSLTLLQDKQIQFPSAPSGAGVFRETNGMRQYITSLNNAAPSTSAVARCFMDARVIE